jgi:bifunctional polynucleotide phosphatase/kinase
MIECARKNLSEGRSVVIDATNPYKEKRSDYIAIAKELKILVRILWFIRDGRPFNELRGTYDSNLGGYRTDATYYHKKPVPDVAYNVYSKNFEEPTEDEGEVEIIY